jgi:DNA-binding HxlR family transcriptional regulator
VEEVNSGGTVGTMPAQRIDPANCSVARALTVVGERWSLLIVREALDGARRFAEFQARLGIARNLLSTRLDTLVTTGILQRVPYQESGDRQRFEYRLTEQGHALRPTLIALLQWADEYLPAPEGPSVVVRHLPGCDEPVKVVLECAAGHGHLAPEAAHRAPGPGARFLPA